MSLQDPEIRKKCFDARDEYHQCYKKEGKEECTNFLQVYSQACPEKWRQFYDQRFEDEKSQQFYKEQEALANLKPKGKAGASLTVFFDS